MKQSSGRAGILIAFASGAEVRPLAKTWPQRSIQLSEFLHLRPHNVTYFISIFTEGHTKIT
jgi:hypothetical protein